MDKSAKNSVKRVVKAGRDSRSLIVMQVLGYAGQGLGTDEVVQIMRDKHSTPVVKSWVQGLVGD